MEKIVNFFGVVMSGVAIAAIGAGITFYHDFGVMRNDLKHIRKNVEVMRDQNSSIVKNHEERIRELELKLVKKLRDAKNKS